MVLVFIFFGEGGVGRIYSMLSGSEGRNTKVFFLLFFPARGMCSLDVRCSYRFGCGVESRNFFGGPWFATRFEFCSPQVSSVTGGGNT